MTQYSEIAADLRRRILEGEFVVGSHLPSEQAIAEEYLVSRKTVRNALAALARRNILSSHRGTGWFVAETEQTQGFDQMRSFAQWAKSRHLPYGGLIVHREYAPASVREARLLRIRAGARVIRFIRLRMLNGRTVMVERSTWAPWVIPIIANIPDDISSTTEVLAESGIEVVYGNHRIEAVPASSEDARLLGTRRTSPLLQVGRETYSRDGRTVEVGEDRYLPNTIVFEVQASSSTPFSH